MEFDPNTLVMYSLFLTAVMGFCLLITARKDYPDNIQKSMQCWGIAYLIQTVGWWLLAESKFITSAFPTIMLGSSLVIWSQAEVYHALRIFDETPSRWRLSYGMTGLSFLAGLAWLAVPDFLLSFVFIESLLAAAILAMCGARLIKAPMGKPSTIRQILCSIFSLQCLVQFLRCIAILWPGQPLLFLFNDTHWQTLAFGGLAMGGLLTSIGFLLVCNERLNQELLRLAITDELTGLFNRRKIEQMTDLAIQQAEKSQQPLTFLLFDADNFKTINDTYGHLAGDKALQVIAGLMKKNLRSSELVGRLGGDEFVIILPNTPKMDGQKVAERLVSEISEVQVTFEGDEVHLGISYGMAFFASGKSNFTHLLREADKALYRMKRNRIKTDLLAGYATN